MTLESLRPLADHLWQSTWFAALAALLTLALRRNRARVRHAVWMATLCKFLVPVSVLIALGGQVAEVAPMRPQVLVAAGAVSRPFGGPVAVSPSGATAPVPSASYLTDDLLPTALAAVWGCGVLGIACSWFVSWRRIRAMARMGSPMELDIPVPAIASPGLAEPGVFGIVRPTLLLPEGIADHLSPAQLTAVIAHELCHVRYRDNLAAALQMLVETVFWFHPLVWWIGKRAVAERERGCDEEVLQLGNEPHIYAEGILSVCRLYVQSPLACIPGVTGADLKKRIHGIVSGRVARELSFATKAMLVVAGVAGIALPVLIGVASAPPMLGQSETSVSLVPPAGVKFRSVSIVRCKGTMQGDIDSPGPGRFYADCVTASRLVYLAWMNAQVPRENPPMKLSWDPVWAGSASYLYRIEARADVGTSVATMEGPMLQALLADRFGLKIRRVTKNVPAFALTVARGGAKLRLSREGSCDQTVPNCMSGVWGNSRSMTLQARASTLQNFCRVLGGELGGPVIDRTGIRGRFDFQLQFAGSDASGPLGQQLYPSLPEVVETQLGLKLERTTGPQESLVIGHVDKPLPE